MINISKLRVEFRNFTMQDIDLDIESGDYFMLVGPTGSGKTILLETIAGLHGMKSGAIRIDGRDISILEPEKRNIGMVYQDSALFPHLSVADNIVFGLKLRHITPQNLELVLEEISSLVSISHLMDRKPLTLSGGEKQKVALARALAIKPNLLLLDEPLTALDPENRENLQQELKRIHRELKVTIIHVTHDFSEALILGKHMAVIGKGSIKQTGTPEEIFRKPNSEFVARFTLMRNILRGEILSNSEGKGVFRSGSLELVVPDCNKDMRNACIRPEDVTLYNDLFIQTGPNSFTGIITGIEDRGTYFHVIVTLPQEICCAIERRIFNISGLMIGQNVKIVLNSESIHTF
jgi:ABC-type Fe3+/spermidine/putrescine transport system ATPase subunit